MGSGRRDQGRERAGESRHTLIENVVDGRDGCDDALWDGGMSGLRRGDLGYEQRGL